MRIGIDVGILREEKRGVGRYLINLLEKFSQLARDDTFYLYSPGPILYSCFRSLRSRTGERDENWHYRFGNWPLPGSFWLRTFGRRLLVKDQIETFFAPCDILPTNLPSSLRKAVAVHDLTFLLYPETMATYNRFVHRLFFASSLAKADAIITMSEAVKKSLLYYFAFPQDRLGLGDRITVIYEGVDEQFHPYEKEEVKRVLDRYQLKRPYILSVGTLEPRKNYPVLFRAFARLKVDWDLVIIGKPGWKWGEIFAARKALKLTERVKILGYVKDWELPLFYNGAEILVLPSLYEGFGLPVIEALACGIPVICSATGSLPEVGGDACLYFNPHSDEELHFKITSLLSNSELRKTLRERGIRRAQNFTWEKTAEKTLKVLKGE